MSAAICASVVTIECEELALPPEVGEEYLSDGNIASLIQSNVEL